MSHNHIPQFRVSLARSDDELRAAQKLRYDVFVRELGGDGPLVDHSEGLERDALDPYFDHMLLFDDAIGEVVAVYRLMTDQRAIEAGGFYSEAEYDLSNLIGSERKLLELGRSCLHADYRGGAAMHHLWRGLAQYVNEGEIEIMFGVASFHGTDIEKLAGPLSLLHHRHLAPEELRSYARAPGAQRMDLLDEADIDRLAAMRQTPALIKAYLRLGGYVGQGAFIDTAFNTTDVCLIMPTEAISERGRRIYEGPL